MTRKKKKALIIGGGIAGPALALFLKRAGIEVEVFEARTREDQQSGFFLYLAPNGMNVLKELNLHCSLETTSIPTTGIAFFNGKGNQIGELDTSRDGESYGVQGLVVKRAELHRVLHQAVEREGIPMLFGKRLVDVHTAADGTVQALFEDGSSAEGDMLLGADGIGSRIRSRILPKSPRPTYVGMVDCGGFTTLPSLRHLQGQQRMTFGKRAFFAYVVHPSGEVYWFSNIPWPNEPTFDELNAISNQDWKARLLELHGGDPPPIAAIIHATTPERMGKWPLRDLPPLPAWHKGKICLLGDAAHATSPSSGQGASMALESAIVLAKCLRDLPDAEQAFRAFYTRRRDRVQMIIEQSRRNGDRKIPNPFVGFIRDLLLPTFLKMGAKDAKKTYGYRIDWQTRLVPELQPLAT